MGFENSSKFGTPNLTEEEMYKMNRAMNKALWENGQEQKQEQKEEIKKSGFTK